jgi:Holliday junction resolvasome RuvABC DNA-binding subunit
VNALKSLGYQSYEIYKVLKNLPDEISTSEEKITYFLRNV